MEAKLSARDAARLEIRVATATVKAIKRSKRRIGFIENLDSGNSGAFKANFFERTGRHSMPLQDDGGWRHPMLAGVSRVCWKLPGVSGRFRRFELVKGILFGCLLWFVRKMNAGRALGRS